MLKKTLIALLFGMQSVFCVGAGVENQLLKVFYHKGTLGDKLVCYFEHDPVCTYVPKKTGAAPVDQQELVFFISDVAISAGQAHDALKHLNAIKNEYYTVNVSAVSKPSKGLAVVVRFDPRVIACDYTKCDLITRDKGLIFNFYNKKTLETITLKTDPILQYAHSSKNRPSFKIMLDYGHGGEDSGKRGCFEILEKDINLQIGNCVAHLLRERGYTVTLTRDKDIFVPLDKRTLLANQEKVDLFVSIHANSAPDSATQGVETYWTSRSSLGYQASFADEVLRPHITKTLSHLDQRSKSLASSIHTTLLKTMGRYGIVNRGEKQSVTQVLLGTDMPATLIEVGFLSNPREAKKLCDASYQKALADGICKGIEAYCSTISL